MAKEERVDLIKKVYSKTEYPKVIDTKFSELGVISLTNEIDNTFTVADFFEKYNELFYDIPSYGEINTHEYLVKTSGEYIDFNKDNSLIEALQTEISNLRQQLLEAQTSLAEAITGEKIDTSVIDTESNEEQESLSSIAQQAINQSRTIAPEDESSTPITPSPTSMATGGGGGY